jgi:hypothetical protein
MQQPETEHFFKKNKKQSKIHFSSVGRVTYSFMLKREIYQVAL